MIRKLDSSIDSPVKRFRPTTVTPALVLELVRHSEVLCDRDLVSMAITSTGTKHLLYRRKLHGLYRFDWTMYTKYNLQYTKLSIRNVNEWNRLLQHPPTSLTTLTFGVEFNQRIEALPPSLTTLTFGCYFNQPIRPGVLPPTLTTLTFGDHFNQPLEELPASLTAVEFGYDFNQPLQPGVLPSSLSELTFRGDFNQPLLEGVLPSSLTKLTFGDCFDHPLEEDALPSSLAYLELGFAFQRPLLPGMLPLSLKQLVFCPWYEGIQPLRPAVPQSCTICFKVNGSVVNAVWP